MLTTHRHDRRARFLLESLDDRLVLSAGAGGAAAEAVVHHPVADHPHHARRRAALWHGSPAMLTANVSAALRSLYRQYEDRGGSRFAPGPPGGGPHLNSSTKIAVLVKVAFPPALDAYLPDLREDRLQVIRTSAAHGLAEGMLPIAELPAVAQDAASVRSAPLPIRR
jgi:hypothetical protein